ncbi:class F sortase [Streptomyces sp. NRRL S-1448]|uniref:class F sortase n=1 Tax=Streptomyces sp. NRRL S-1448 TaxID=1463883 RepID=UPI0004BED57E|nr:class F sortase [Streptomyces sp. NRRL S-1448]
MSAPVRAAATTGRRSRRALGGGLAAAVAAVLLAGCGGQDAAPPRSLPAEQPGQGGHAAHDEASAATDGPGAATASMPTSDPVRLSIPALKVSSTLETLGQHPDGTMETPRDPAKAGWYRPGPTPGARGPAVIAGHVTWNGTPSVFQKLSSMKRGDTIDVARKDGSTAKFTVDRVAQYPKNKFPTVEVYQNLDHAGLRLITCGGDYDQGKHYYPDNVVVFASLTGKA